MRRSLGIVLLLGLCVPSIVRAQAKGFALDRFDPAEHGSDWFAAESLDFRGRGRPAVGLVLDWSHKPLVLYDANGNESAALVKDQLFAHLGGALILWDRVRFGANLPIALVQSGQAATVGTTRVAPSQGTTIGDIRLAADVRLLGEYGQPFTLALGLRGYLPSGSRAAYTGDGKIRLTPRLMAAGDISLFAYAVQAAFVYRAQTEDLAGVARGSELGFNAAAGVKLAGKRLLIGPELWGTTVLKDGAAFKRATTPFELAFSGHYRVPNWVFGIGVGPGLTRGLGAPQVRVLGSVAFMPDVPAPPPPAPLPEAPPSDRDHDGVIDREDACPDVAGAKSADASKNGCPPDRDGDGVIDSEDACPDVAGVKSDDPNKNGCPPDRDGDGVSDSEDACPDVAGVKSADPSKNGCPPDRDGDGVIDVEDACPDAAGPRSEDPKKNGCPEARVEQGQIKILERIEFKTNSAELLAASTPVLEAVRKILSEHPEIARVSVEGHTDNVGSAKYNQRLSQRRAEAVMKWLAEHGIARTRLEAHGFGLERPIESNDTAEGRDRNRRVEFQIRDGSGGEAGEE